MMKFARDLYGLFFHSRVHGVKLSDAVVQLLPGIYFMETLYKTEYMVVKVAGFPQLTEQSVSCGTRPAAVSL